MIKSPPSQRSCGNDEAFTGNPIPIRRNENHPSPEPSMKKKSLPSQGIVFAILLAVGPAVHANITVTGKWTLDDPGALHGIAIASAVDSAGTRNLYQNNLSAATYSSDVPLPGVTEIPLSSANPSAPALSASFTATGPTSAYLAPSPAATYDYSDNFGVEVWVKSGQASQSATILFNGDAGASKGWGFIQDGTNYQGVLGGLTLVGSAPATTNGWTHLALVRDTASFGTRLYVNGVLNATVSSGINPTAGAADGSIFSLGARASAQRPFTGRVADARVFTFASGAFVASDLNVTPKPATGPGRAAWMRGKYGLFIGYAPGVNDITGTNNGSWDATVNAFDTDAFAADVNATGASFVVFNLGWITGHYCMPNQTFVNITGQTGYCSQRNLIRDIYNSLQAVNPDIKVMVYLASEGPRLAPATITNPSALNCENGAGPLWADFRKKFNAMVKEWSTSAGSMISGWWLDGAYTYWGITYDSNGTIVYNDPADGSRGLDNLNALITACRAGNPNAAVACNTYMLPTGPNGYTTYADYTTGEVDFFERTPISPTVSVTDANGTSTLHWNATSFLGNVWGNSNATKFSNLQLANHVYFVCQYGGSLMIDMAPSRSGHLYPAQLAQMAAVKTAVRVNQTYADYSFLNNGIKVTNVAAFKPSWLMSSRGDYELPINARTASMSYGNDMTMTCHFTDPSQPWNYDPTGRNFATPGEEYDWNYKVDLGAPKQFNYYVLTMPAAMYATAYAIEGSSNGIGWDNLLSVTGTAGGRQCGYLNSTSNYRYVRVRAITPNGPGQPGTGMAIQEFELYQMPVSNNLAYLKQCRFDSYGANIGISGVPVVENDYMTGFIGTDPSFGNTNQEYRTVWQFRLDSLGIAPGDVVTAKLNWTPSAIWGGKTLAIDQVPSDFTTWNTIPMYGGALSTIATGLSNINPPSAPGIDITEVFKAALANATPTSGLALRFYVVGGAGDFNGGGIRNVNIELVTAPPAKVPSHLALSLVKSAGVNHAVLTGSGGSGALGYCVESSTDLVDWTTIAIGQGFGPGGAVNFTQALANPLPSKMFYRISVPE
jgi:hypothetical protein